jgi:hypothetical protein
MTAAGFPHSGITGSKPACGSPMLFAAYHALLRLSVPRHPPCALVRLTGNSELPHPISHSSKTTHTQNPSAPPPGCPFPHFLPRRTNSPRKAQSNGRPRKSNVRCSPRPLLHTTLNPNCQFRSRRLGRRPASSWIPTSAGMTGIWGSKGEKKRKEFAGRATLERFRSRGTYSQTPERR